MSFHNHCCTLCSPYSELAEVSSKMFQLKQLLLRCAHVFRNKLSILHGKQIDLNATIGTVSPLINPVKLFGTGITYLVCHATDWNLNESCIVKAMVGL